MTQKKIGARELDLFSTAERAPRCLNATLQYCKRCEATTRHGARGRCIPCNVAWVTRSRRTRLIYATLYEEQKGRCKICGRVSTRTMHLDHDDKTGEDRGLLCCSCNLILGHAHDSPEILRAAAAYLEKFSPKHRPK